MKKILYFIILSLIFSNCVFAKYHMSNLKPHVQENTGLSNLKPIYNTVNETALENTSKEETVELKKLQETISPNTKLPLPSDKEIMEMIEKFNFPSEQKQQIFLETKKQIQYMYETGDTSFIMNNLLNGQNLNINP